LARAAWSGPSIGLNSNDDTNVGSTALNNCEMTMKQDRTGHGGTTVSRRRALRQFASGIAAATAIPTELGAATLARGDPVHAAIERHRAAWQMYKEHADRCDRFETFLLANLRRSGIDGDSDEVAAVEDDPRWQDMQAACDAAAEAADAAAWALIDSEPTTLGGAAALLAYAHDFVASGATWPDDISDGPALMQDWNSKLHRSLAVALTRLAKAPA
jgi:hypothetical protein